MQSALHLTSSYGLPLCVAAIPPPLALSREIADHDRHRKAGKKLRSRARSHALPELTPWSDVGITAVQGTMEGEAEGDLAEPSHCGLPLVAKAA